jgi:hypothetical protein
MNLSSEENFQKSYLDYRRYPFNLISAPIYGSSSLHAYHQRFHEISAHLDNANIEVPVKDISKDGVGTKLNIFTEKGFDDMVGSPPGLEVKQDPSCRFL